MSSDFNPGKHSQSDHAKEEVESIRTGFGILLFVCFTLSQSVQFFSRVPGTGGVLYVPAFLFCMIVQFLVCSALIQSSGQPDLISIELAFGIQFAMLIWVVIRTFVLRSRGFEAEINQFGVGILHRWMPASDSVKVGFASDMLIGICMTVFCYMFNSPSLGSWYLFMTFSLLFIHQWMAWLQRSEMQRLKQAQQRAQSWTNKLNRTNGR